MSIRVLVIDDEPLARLGVTTRLGAYSDMLVVGECGTGEEALNSIPLVAPDLLFVDVEMPGLSGIDLLRRLPKETVRCVVFLPPMKNMLSKPLMWRRSIISSSRLTTPALLLVSSVPGGSLLFIVKKLNSSGFTVFWRRGRSQRMMVSSGVFRYAGETSSNLFWPQMWIGLKGWATMPDCMLAAKPT